jgi:hypothetical protein
MEASSIKFKFIFNAFFECRRLNCDEILALIGNDDKLLEVLELFIGVRNFIF